MGPWGPTSLYFHVFENFLGNFTGRIRVRLLFRVIPFPQRNPGSIWIHFRLFKFYLYSNRKEKVWEMNHRLHLSCFSPTKTVASFFLFAQTWWIWRGIFNLIKQNVEGGCVGNIPLSRVVMGLILYIDIVFDINTKFLWNFDTSSFTGKIRIRIQFRVVPFLGDPIINHFITSKNNRLLMV